MSRKTILDKGDVLVFLCFCLGMAHGAWSMGQKAIADCGLRKGTRLRTSSQNPVSV